MIHQLSHVRIGSTPLLAPAPSIAVLRARAGASGKREGGREGWSKGEGARERERGRGSEGEGAREGVGARKRSKGGRGRKEEKRGGIGGADDGVGTAIYILI